jgi:CRP/FNR family cyclic AMP-dependent transcriptional regulator
MPAVAVSTGPDPTILSSSALFRGFTAEQLEPLRGHVRRKTYQTGTNLISAEQPGGVVFIILSGTVKIQVDQADGTEVILAVLGAGQSVGEMSVTDKLTRSASVVTLEESTLAWIDDATFSRCLSTMPGLIDNLAKLLSSRLRVANAQIQALATQDVYGRVARQLLSLAEEYGVSDGKGGVQIPVRLTQSELGSLVGASRVRVNQALVLFKEQKYISVDNANRITVRNAAALAARCP